MAPEPENNFFERHARKTLALVVLLSVVAGIYALEKFLAYRNKGIGFNFALPNRAIVLREFNPTLREYNYPAKEDLPYDTLRNKGYLLRVDQNGFIMPSERYPHPDITLVFLGDSVTAELLVDEDNRFPYVAATLLEKNLNIKINSYNASRIANNTLHSLDVLLNKVIPLQPDIVIMMHNNNDVATMLYEKTYWNDSPTRSIIFDTNKNLWNNFFKIMRDRLIPNLSREMRLAGTRLRGLWDRDRAPGAGRDEFAKMRGHPIRYNPAEMVEQFEMNLQTFVAICKIRAIVPVLMTMASRFKDEPEKNVLDRFQSVVVSYREYKRLFDLFNDSIRKIGRDHHLLVIDLAAALPPEKEYIYDSIHYNDRGSLQAAEIIGDRLEPLVRQIWASKRQARSSGLRERP